MEITAVLPVSRTAYLDRVLDALVNQTLKPKTLVVIFDGTIDDYLEVRYKVKSLPFDVFCTPATNPFPARDLLDRRKHIANIHNQIRESIKGDLVWSIEDDGLIPVNALEKLFNFFWTHRRYTGLVTGVELGRWGIPYVGAWRADHVNNTAQLTSLENKAQEGGWEEVDASGLYCALINADYYKEHEFFTTNGLGPDVNLGLYIRQQGLLNFIDWSVHVTHLSGNKEIHATDKSKVVTLKHLHGSTWQY